MQYQKILFQSRKDAALQLREHLPLERMKSENWNIIAVSRGGLEVAHNLRSHRLKLPLDFLLTEAILAPNNHNCEIARVSETEEIVMHEALVNAFDVRVDYIYGEASRKHEEKILSSIYKFRKGKAFESQEGKTVLLVDDGAESGLKLMTAIKTVLAQRPRAVYVAVPVLPEDVAEMFEPLVDDVFYAFELADFVNTESYYADFKKISDEEVVSILEDENDL